MVVLRARLPRRCARPGQANNISSGQILSSNSRSSLPGLKNGILFARWLGKPLPSEQPWSSGAPRLHHGKEYHSVSLYPGRRHLEGGRAPREEVAFRKVPGLGFVEDVTPVHLNERTPGLRPSWRRRLAPGCSPVWAFNPRVTCLLNQRRCQSSQLVVEDILALPGQLFRQRGEEVP